MRFAEDWNALIDLTRSGDIAFLDDVILDYRRHATNVGASPGVPVACRWVRVNQYHSPKNSPEQQRVAREAYRAAQVLEVRERLGRMQVALRSGRIVEAAAQAARLPSRASRYVRGRPSQRTVPG